MLLSEPGSSGSMRMVAARFVQLPANSSIINYQPRRSSMMPYILSFVSGYAVTISAVYYLDLKHRGVIGAKKDGGKK